MTQHKSSNFEAFFSQKSELLPAPKPACKSFPAFSRRGQNVFITYYKNIHGWLI